MARFVRAASIAVGVMLMVGAFCSLASAAPPNDVPELDPGSITSALTLLSGGLLVLAGRRAKK